MTEWCIPFGVTLTLTFTSGLISRFFVLYYSYLSSNVSYARPIPLGAFVTCLRHFLLKEGILLEKVMRTLRLLSRILLLIQLILVQTHTKLNEDEHSDLA